MQPQITTVTEVSQHQNLNSVEGSTGRKTVIVSWKFRPYGLASAVILEILTFGQIPTHSPTDTARVVKDVQNDIVSVKRRPIDASEMAKRWFKSHEPGRAPIKQPLALEAAALAFGCPKKWDRKRRHFHVLLEDYVVGFLSARSWKVMSEGS